MYGHFFERDVRPRRDPFHRLQHRSAILWRTHEAHHSAETVDWLAGSRSHALEILINQTIEYAPIVLLGAHPDVALMKGVLDAAWGMYIRARRQLIWTLPLTCLNSEAHLE